MQAPTRRTVFLDFLSPDNGNLYGGNTKLAIRSFSSLLSEGLNIAALLCGDICLLPPFFPLQSEAARSVLESKVEFLNSGLIRLPVRETSLGEFFDKKTKEYGRVRSSYPGLFSGDGERFVESHAASVIHRYSRVGSTIAARWEAGPDEETVWRPLIKMLQPKLIEHIRKIPNQLKEAGDSVTWAAMVRYLPSSAALATFELNELLQHEYTRLYLDEFNARIISGLPPKTTDLRLHIPDLSYDYSSFRRVLEVVGLWPTLAIMKAVDVIRLRNYSGFMDFISVFQRTCLECVDSTGVARVFAAALRGENTNRRLERRAIQSIFTKVQRSMLLSEYDLESLDSYLFTLAAVIKSGGQHALREEHLGYHDVSTKGGNVPKKTVFLVHGHDHAVRDEICLFLTSKNLNVEVLDDNAWGGTTIVEKLENLAANADYVIIVATPDDELTEVKTGEQIFRIRQNVILEIGYFWGAFGRIGRFALLLKEAPGLELPSDIAGLGYIKITDDLGDTKRRLEKELVAASVLP